MLSDFNLYFNNVVWSFPERFRCFLIHTVFTQCFFPHVFLCLQRLFVCKSFVPAVMLRVSFILHWYCKSLCFIIFVIMNFL